MKIKQACTLSLAALMATGMLMTGCSGTASTADDSSTDAAATEQDASTRTVTGDDGVEVTIPAQVDRVAPTIGAFSQVTEMLTQGNGKIVAAATNNISDAFKSVFTDYTESNPDNRDASSVEDLIAADTQVVYGPKTAYSDEQLAQLEAADIAFVNLSHFSTVDDMCNCIETIGEILGEDEAAMARQFVEYYRNSISDASDRTAGLSDGEKVTVLQLSNNGGQYTCTNGDDICNEYFTAAGAVNIAADYAGTSSGSGTSLTVDAEQIVEWNPRYIIAMNATARDAILNDAALANVDAVANGNVYTCPTGLYLWSVRSGEGAMMTPWLGTLFYPDLFSDVDMVQVVQDFYETYYNYDLPESEAQAIVNPDGE